MPSTYIGGGGKCQKIVFKDGFLNSSWFAGYVLSGQVYLQSDSLSEGSGDLVSRVVSYGSYASSP